MSLYDRSWGYELTELEKELIFRRENTGYVKWVDKKRRIAHVYPSPFLRTNENEYYIFLTEDLPEERDLIECKVENTQRIPLNQPIKGQYYYLIKKEVVEWKRINPYKLLKKITLTDLGLDPMTLNLDEETMKALKRTEYWDGHLRSLVDLDLARELVRFPFKSADEIITDTILMYLMSSPPKGYRGGITAAALIGKKSVWNALQKLFTAIPSEFKRINSLYYYKHSTTPGNLVLDSITAEEVNLEFTNPEHIHIHVPQPLLDVTVREGAISKIKDELFLLRLFMLQGLLLTPRIREGAEEAIREGIFKVHEAMILSREKLPFLIDMTFVKRVPLSMGRLTMKEEIGKRDIKMVIDNWLDAYSEALKIEVKRIAPRFYFKLTKHERIVYNTIAELGGFDRPVSLNELLNEISKKIHGKELSEEFVEKILNELRLKGYIYEPRSGWVRAVELK